MKHLIIWTLLLSASAFAGKEGGNGGDVLVCKDENKNITSVELLDFYEARVKGRIKGIDLGDDSLSFSEKVQYAIDRLEKLDQRRAKKYRDRFKAFFNEDQFGWADRLVNIDDTGSLGIPQNCDIEQIATQEEASLPGDKRILIVKRYWDLLDANNKAGLVLHELIYSEAMDLRLAYANRPEGAIHLHSNSKKVRYFNSIIGSSDFNEMNYSDYYGVVKESDFIYVSFDGIYFPLVYFDKFSEGSKRQHAEVRFNPDTNKPIYLRGDVEIMPGYGFVDAYAVSRYITQKLKNEIKIYKPFSLEFDEKGKLNSKRVTFKGRAFIRVSDYLTLKLDGAYSYLTFESGELADNQKELNGTAAITTNNFKIQIPIAPREDESETCTVPVILKDKYGMPDFRSLSIFEQDLDKKFEHLIFVNGRLAKIGEYFDYSPVRMSDNSYYLSGFKNLHFDPETGEPKACIYRSLKGRNWFKYDSSLILCASFESLWNLKKEQLRPYGAKFKVQSKTKPQSKIKSIAINKCEQALRKYNSEVYLECGVYCYSENECTSAVYGKGMADWPTTDLFIKE